MMMTQQTATSTADAARTVTLAFGLRARVNFQVQPWLYLAPALLTLLIWTYARSPKPCS
jgi:hypothetical protein